ncbi:hypothetical protein CBM2623_A80176 [Cupriavidus taiwanensis]|nr:hypothetical protein CBM2608_A70137 [Cupriavidus taiwanensis]SPA31667.1 hypothetical protein CBM2623_A80176 [Cupriavidus taiwanensis]SPA47153.1 hypothetical protein CBM2629_A80242 [Cupriavidus taiwanensis]
MRQVVPARGRGDAGTAIPRVLRSLPAALYSEVPKGVFGVAVQGGDAAIQAWREALAARTIATAATICAGYF